MRDFAALAGALAVGLVVAGCGSSDGAGGAAPRKCNGHAELCDRSFDAVAYPATHNSMSNADDGWLIPNQTHNIAQQLEDGVRALLIDTHEYNGDVWLCHASCLAGSELLVDGLGEIKTFMDKHPREVITLIIEDYITAAQTAQAFADSGLDKYVYVYPPGAPWPTLGDMIDSDQRLLVTAQDGHPPPDWYQNAWDLMWDTPYTFKSEAEFSCDLNRGSQGNPLFLLNHWVENPLADPALSTTANQYDVLYGRAKQCWGASGQLPNFVAVNHYSIGDLFKAVDKLNGF